MAGDLTEPAASAILTFSHRIQRAKAWAFGHVRCAQLSAPLSSTARRACAPCRFCQSHEPQRGRPGPGTIIQKGLSHDNGSYPGGRADPCRLLPGELLPEEGRALSGVMSRRCALLGTYR